MAVGDHGRGADQVSLRLPPGMRERIKAAAGLSGRSMNAEIIATLEKAYPNELDQLHAAVREINAAISRAPEHMQRELQATLEKLTDGIFF